MKRQVYILQNRGKGSLNDVTVDDLFLLVDESSSIDTTGLATQEYVDNEINAAVVGFLDDRGNYDASSDLFPSSGGSGTAGAILKGDLWTVSVAGTLGGNAVSVGDVVRALVDAPGQTSANWAVSENNLGYVAENSANKTDTMAGNTASSTKYLSAKGVYDYLIGMTWLTDTIFGTWLNGLTAKNTLVDADSIVSVDSADSNKSKKTSWLNVWTNYLKGKADAVYQQKIIKQGYTQLTGVTGTQVLASLEIPADWIASGDGFEIVVSINKSTTAASIDYRLYHDTVINGTANAITTATAIAPANRVAYLQRLLSLNGTTLYNCLTFGNSSLIPANLSNFSTTTFNPAVANYITLVVNPTVTSESCGFITFYIRKL